MSGAGPRDIGKAIFYITTQYCWYTVPHSLVARARGILRSSQIQRRLFKLIVKKVKCNIAFLNPASLPIASFEAHNVARARCVMLHEAVPAENTPRRTARLTPSQPNHSARPHPLLSVDMASSALPVRSPHAALIAVCLSLSLCAQVTHCGSVRISSLLARRARHPTRASSRDRTCTVLGTSLSLLLHVVTRMTLWY